MREAWRKRSFTESAVRSVGILKDAERRALTFPNVPEDIVSRLHMFAGLLKNPRVSGMQELKVAVPIKQSATLHNDFQLDACRRLRLNRRHGYSKPNCA